MNILLSYDWLKEYVKSGMSPDEFAARVSLSGPGIEHLYRRADEFEHMVVGKIKEIVPHPKADKLKIAKTDIGTGVADIVCGGSNIVEGQWVVVATEGAKVRWHGEGEPVELERAEIRGVLSDGMICAANEIGLYDAFPHPEREILDLGAALPGAKLEAGMSLAKALGIENDVLMDIEVTTNRIDAFSIVGMARETAAILNKPFTWKASKLQKSTKKPLTVTVSEKKLCQRYMGVKIEGVRNGSSPWWMKSRLISAGLRPINTIVDITNYVMLELGQPMHAFDAETLKGDKIVVRMAKAGEELPALDGETYELKDRHLVIADAERPVAIAGVMGGEETSVTSDTISVVFEAATFDPVSVRRTARELNLYSDSQYRFEKGLSTEAPPDALARAVELCLDLCGGKLASGVADIRTTANKPKTYSITFEEIDSLIGVDVPKKKAKDVLERLGFTLRTTGSSLHATVPWWRDHDIEAGRDLVEEIARMEGYAALPAVFPAGISHIPEDPVLSTERALRSKLEGVGLNEIFTYSFVSKELLELSGFDASEMLRVQNPLTADFEYMRTSLLPSMLQVMMQNHDRFPTQELFEMSRVYLRQGNGKSQGSAWKQLPDEVPMLALGVLGEDAWKKTKGLCEHVLDELHIPYEWRPLTDSSLWHPGRAAQAFSGDVLVATCGELHPVVAARYGFQTRVGIADMPIRELVSTKGIASYIPVPQFPEAKRDMAIIVDKLVTVRDIVEASKEATSLLTRIEWFDTYTRKGLDENRKSLAFHLEFSVPDRTLETHEVDSAMKDIVRALEERFEAELRS